MEASTRLIGSIIELSPCMQGGKYEPFRTDSFLMHPHRDTPAIVRYCGRAVTV